MAIPTAKETVLELLAELEGKTVAAAGEIRTHNHSSRHCYLCSFVKLADSLHTRIDEVREELEWIL
jgi:hypothetical protein